MISIDDIKPHQIVKVLVCYDDIEEELFAKVITNTGGLLFLTYLEQTEKLYKGACVYAFCSKAECASVESVTEHYDCIDIEEIGVTQIDRNMFVFEEDIDVDDDCSDIYDDDEDDEDLRDFIVPDGPMELPPDHVMLDERWSAWQPDTEGGQRFKNVVDRIEARVRLQMDEQEFLGA